MQKQYQSKNFLKSDFFIKLAIQFSTKNNNFMKKIFTLILGVSFLSSLSAQTYCEDFEGFTIGDPIGASSSVWTTWAANINPGLNPPYSDDVIVDGTQANSGNNSLYLTDATGNGGPQDILLPLHRPHLLLAMAIQRLYGI